VSPPRGAGLRTYLTILATPGAARLVAASLLARLSFGLFDLALVLLVQRATGSFAAAGLALGLHAVGVAVTAPLRGRLLDRLGARRALPPLLVINAASVVAIPLVDAPALAVALATVTGLTAPPFVAAMRLEWQRLLGIGSPQLATAYAFETAAQIGVFVIGPLLAAGGIALAGPSAPLLVSAALSLGFGLVFARLARTIPLPDRTPARGLGALRHGGVQTLVAATLLGDTSLGIVDIAVIAFATERGSDAASGVLLALFTTGAVLGAALAGTREWRMPALRRLPIVLGVYGAALAVLALPHSIVLFGALLLPAGAPSAIQWATASVALDDVTPPGQGAEGATWLSSANAAGIAAGGVVAGALIEASGTTAAFLAAAGLAVFASLVVAAANARSRSRSATP
jgi:predicted MFS family arabinose efflux permease